MGDSTARALGPHDQGGRRRGRHRGGRADRRAGDQHAACGADRPEGRGPAHDVRLAARSRHGRQVQRAGQVHHDHRLRVDADAGWRQPAPQRAAARRAGPCLAGVSVHLLEQRGSRAALGLDGVLRTAHRRSRARDSAQRQPVQRPHVRDAALRRIAAVERLRRRAGSAGSRSRKSYSPRAPRRAIRSCRRTTNSSSTASPAGNSAT